MDARSRCVDNLILAFVELQNECTLVMVGDGPDLQFLQAMSANLG